ncbi:MAG: serine/threonine-protein kinase, partial [Gemmataceae bacterium]
MSADAHHPPERMGDFRILRPIGHGGMGVVYEAEQVSLGRRVALKLLPARLLSDPDYRYRFEREAKAAARLHHPHIVPVFGAGEHDGVPYYAMQFIRGRPLDAVLAGQRRRETASTPTAGFLPAAEPDSPSAETTPVVPAAGRDWRTMAALAVQAADALAYAHAQGVLHRDIKPGNLLLDEAGHLWVTDFGLAKASGLDDLTPSGDVLGTLRYLPPEAFKGRTDARSDVFALGLTLWEMLSLRPAYEQREHARLLPAVMAGEVPELDPALGLPPDVIALVRKATAANPSRRYQTAADLAQDLRRLLAGEPVRARPSGRNVRPVHLLALIPIAAAVAWPWLPSGRPPAEPAAPASAGDRRVYQRAYAADARLAQRAWEDGQFDRVRELLAGMEPDQV